MRPAPPSRWSAARAEHQKRARSRCGLLGRWANHDLRRRPIKYWRRRASRFRWPNDRPGTLCRCEQFLTPTLLGGDVVVMDNLAVHDVAGVRDAIASVISPQSLQLPTDSPDLHPVKQILTKLRCSCARPLPERGTRSGRHRQPTRNRQSRRMSRLPHRVRICAQINKNALVLFKVTTRSSDFWDTNRWLRFTYFIYLVF